jgi:hypothetical protein
MSHQCTPSWRDGMFPDYKNCNLGFRIVMVEKPKPVIPPVDPTGKPEAPAPASH